MKKPSLHIKDVKGMGRGVFAGRNFSKGEIIERCPLIIVGSALGNVAQIFPLLHEYAFEADGAIAITLGYGSLYNHSKDPNAIYVTYMNKREIVIAAKKTIQYGEQIFLDYGYPDHVLQKQFQMFSVLRSPSKP